MGRIWNTMAQMALLVSAQLVNGVVIDICSNENTADGTAIFATFQSNGRCSGNCTSDYAFAITQGNDCWCSNYAPENTVSIGSCNEKCPGYPYEYCGSTSGLYGYIALNLSPSGTIAGSTGSATSSKSSQSESTSASTSGRPFDHTTVVESSSSSSSGSSSTTVTLSSSSSSSSTTSSSSSVESPTSDSSTSTTESSSTTDSQSTITSGTAAQTSQASLITSIVTLPGQTRISTVVITPTASSDASILGQGATNNSGGNSLSKGTVAGMAVGIALGVMLIAGVIFLFLWRRLKQARAAREAELTPEIAPSAGSGGTPSSMSRHTSQMSQAGLIGGKVSRLNTRNLANGWSSNGHSAGSTISPTTTNTKRRSLGADQRLDPYSAIYTNEDLRHSDVSLQDNTDYSRKILSVRNRGDGEVDDD